MSKGFTLIETTIYIALFAIVIGGGMVSTFQIIQGTDSGDNHVILQEEANFLLRKINWAMTGASSFAIVNSPLSLTVTKSGTTYKFDFSGTDIRLNSTVLNSSSILVSAPSFSSIGTTGVTSSFTLTTYQSGRTAFETFSTTKYLRQ